MPGDLVDDGADHVVRIGLGGLDEAHAEADGIAGEREHVGAMFGDFLRRPLEVRRAYAEFGRPPRARVDDLADDRGGSGIPLLLLAGNGR